ncbi:IclR family transcriptional regulator [Terriglobus tenax]|uniref:IclR family transcriptional regulator n=1 Tax=Terriglobus tenax TaxID=1111115 RepID=UPI0021DF9801|nr:IclR family transcriptional regulator [Terriglobus tenax]
MTKSVPAVERAFAMLEALDYAKSGMNIADLSRKLAIPRSTAHTIALTLERCGYLTRDASQRNCMLSTKAYMLGRDAVRPDRMAVAALRPMRRFSTQTLLTSHLAILDQTQAVYIQKVQGPGLVSMETYPGKRTNLHCTGVGKVLLGYASEGFRTKVLSRGVFARYTRNTITMTSLLREELRRVAEQGYALDNQEEELDIRCLAVPMFSVRNEFLAALSVSGTTQQIRDNLIPALVARLHHTARIIAERLQSGVDDAE